MFNKNDIIIKYARAMTHTASGYFFLIGRPVVGIKTFFQPDENL